MRLKQLLVVLLLLVISSVAAIAGATPQLTNVSVVGEGTRSTVTVHASGAFVHNEYRPADNLLLVDLAGVAAGKLNDRERALHVAGIKSYHVVGYTGAGGMQIARIELNLVENPAVHISERKDGLVIDIDAATRAATHETQAAVGGTGGAAPVSGAQSEQKLSASNAAAPAPAPAAAASSGPSAQAGSAVRHVDMTVMRTDEGIAVEVTADGPIDGRLMKLVHPDRVVLDVPNADFAGRPRKIAVNFGEVRAVRLGRFQDDPPVTRIVLDLAAPRGFELAKAGNKLILEPQAATAAMASGSTAATLKPVAAVVPVSPSTTPVTKIVPVATIPPALAEPASTADSIKTPAVANSVAEPDYKGGEHQSAQDYVIAPSHVEEHVGNSPDPQAPTQHMPEQNAPIAANNPPASAPAMATPVTVSAAQASAGPAQETQAPEHKTQAPAHVPPGVPVQPSVNFAAEQREQGSQATPTTAPRYTGEPISVNLKDVDIKDFFRLIHEISGLNIVLDPNVKGSLTLVLDDVPWDQALDIVLKNNGLDRQLEGNVLRIATVDDIRKEAEAHRRQLEAQSLAVNKVTVTRFLSYAHAKDVLPTIKRQLSSRGDIVADERTNALIISDIPSVIPPIDRLLAQLDRKTQEVEIEARVVAATRSFARDIGTQLGFGFGNSATAVGGASAVGNSPAQVGYVAPPPYITSPIVPLATATPSATAASIPLFSNLAAAAPTSGLSLLNLGRNYRLDAVLTAAESRGLLKILSRPRVITQNNIQAVVKQGQRVPITTLGQLGGPPTVTYVEAVLRLTVTPQITAENTIFLNVDIENTTPDFSHTIQGNPVFLTQQTTTQVLVTNGGTVVIGGVLQTNNSITINQVPFLGSVPGLGNLFKHRAVNTSTQELLFFLTPRIVET